MEEGGDGDAVLGEVGLEGGVEAEGGGAQAHGGGVDVEGVVGEAALVVAVEVGGGGGEEEGAAAEPFHDLVDALAVGGVEEFEDLVFCCHRGSGFMLFENAKIRKKTLTRIFS